MANFTALIKKIFPNIPYRSVVLGLTISNILIIAFLMLFKKNLPPVVPLLYGKPYGAEQIVPQVFLVLPEIVAIVLIIINSLLSIKTKEEFLQKVLVGSMIVYTLLGAITTIRIIFLVGNI